MLNLSSRIGKLEQLFSGDSVGKYVLSDAEIGYCLEALFLPENEEKRAKIGRMCIMPPPSPALSQRLLSDMINENDPGAEKRRQERLIGFEVLCERLGA